ncbi:uncharacterized protein LOC106669667 isoform X2 [Cimex lectularius]|uniref:Uncharacterized protein n=1 Tax=Cimex lectularius TaxID=79782 RepID=A0A8I6S2U5_CIMLE|nr:uncharacterized protein LOC106669667 isoform X2 [Cimex lectularius]XP_024080445.1 uncharacterized protein LOC106669667 isoform X2 [Cimex lectularius]
MRLDPTVKTHPGRPSVQQCWGTEDGRCPKATARRKQDASVIVAGVAVASSCQIVLPIFGALFFIVGTVLTIASYRGPENDEDPEQYADRVNLTSNLRVLGPCCLAIGLAMLLAGLGLFLLARRNKNKSLTFHCPLHGDFYPISSSHAHILSLSKRSSLVCGQQLENGDNFPTPQCPHSNRSSLSYGPPPQSSPLPPVTTHNTSGFLTPTNLTMGENSGSTQSLAISYDVASFPHSRSSSPTAHIEQDKRNETNDEQ